MAHRRLIIAGVILLGVAGMFIRHYNRKALMLSPVHRRTDPAVSVSENKRERPGITTSALLTEAEIYAAAGYGEKALALLDVLQEKFPLAPEIDDARLLREKLATRPEARDLQPPIVPSSEIVLPIRPRPEGSIGLITFLVGSGGAAGGVSLSAELDRTAARWLYGAGAAWLRTSETNTIYYIDNPSPPLGTTNLGTYNEGDEYEIFLVAGRRTRERLIVAGSLGFSRQTVVNLEENNATKLLYVTRRTIENYITLSAQARYQVKDFISAIIGYHIRRGLVGGVSVRW